MYRNEKIVYSKWQKFDIYKNCQEKYDGCCNNKCQKMSKLPKDEQKRIRKARKRASLTSFKKSIRPQENIAERNRNTW